MGVKKHSITLVGHKTSISLEDEFWQELEQIAVQKNLSLPKLIGQIDAARQDQNLSSAIRVYVLGDLQRQVLQD